MSYFYNRYGRLLHNCPPTGVRGNGRTDGGAGTMWILGDADGKLMECLRCNIRAKKTNGFLVSNRLRSVRHGWIKK